MHKEQLRTGKVILCFTPEEKLFLDNLAKTENLPCGVLLRKFVLDKAKEIRGQNGRTS